MRIAQPSALSRAPTTERDAVFLHPNTLFAATLVVKGKTSKTLDIGALV
jgi:hypothetical protein